MVVKIFPSYILYFLNNNRVTKIYKAIQIVFFYRKLGATYYATIISSFSDPA